MGASGGRGFVEHLRPPWVENVDRDPPHGHAPRERTRNRNPQHRRLPVTSPPRAINLTLRPRRRPEVTDLRVRLGELDVEDEGPPFAEYPRLLCVSYHTTAGFMDDALRRRLSGEPGSLPDFLDALGGIFPPEAGYHHDRLHLRQELSEEQRETEPLNADAHLSFIGAGFTNCMTARGEPSHPLWFVDFDGAYRDPMDREVRRTRKATVVGYTGEEVVETLERSLDVDPGSRAIRLGAGERSILEGITAVVRGHGIPFGRVDLRLAQAERDAGLTVNEYEALLMKKDLAEVLEAPLRYAGTTSELERAMGALGVSPRRRDRLVDRALDALPARLLRMRREVSLAILPGSEGGRIVLGRYQSPILVQWSASSPETRTVQAQIVRFF